MKYFNALIFTVLISAITFSGCKKKEEDPAPVPTGPTYAVPTTYNFENVDYSGQTTRLDMLTELINEMKSGTSGTVDATVLKNMYANSGAPFTNPDLNAATTKQLKDKTFSLDAAMFEDLMDSVATASESVLPGSNGVSGVVTSSNDATKKYLCYANGYEYTQIVAKGLMGAVLYWQVAGSYLTDAKIGPTVDNETVTPGKGTTMEHHWDEAFGYFGVPIDFPTNKTGLLYWGSYSNKVDAVLGSNSKIMNAFIKGRAAISNKDMDTKDAQVAIITSEWERVSAATAIHYLNTAKGADFADDAIRNHVLSEAIGFVMALKYSPSTKASNVEIASILSHIGTNLYEIEIADINNAIDEISTIYDMDSIKNNL